MDYKKLIWTSAAAIGGGIVAYISYRLIKKGQKKKEIELQMPVDKKEPETPAEPQVPEADEEAKTKAEAARVKPDLNDIVYDKYSDLVKDVMSDLKDSQIEDDISFEEDFFEDDEEDIEDEPKAYGIHEIPKHVFTSENSDRNQVELEYYSDGFLVDSMGRELDPRKVLGTDILKKLDSGYGEDLYVRDEDTRKDYFVKVLDAKWDSDYIPGDFADEVTT